MGVIKHDQQEVTGQMNSSVFIFKASLWLNEHHRGFSGMSDRVRVQTAKLLSHSSKAKDETSERCRYLVIKNYDVRFHSYEIVLHI